MTNKLKKYLSTTFVLFLLLALFSNGLSFAVNAE